MVKFIYIICIRIGVIQLHSNERNSNHIILILFNYLLDIKIDPKQICKEAGVDYSLFQDKNGELTIQQEEEIWHHAIEKSGSESFGLNLGRNFHGYAQGHFLTTLLSNSPNIDVVFKNIESFHDLLHGNKKLDINFSSNDDTSTFKINYYTNNTIVGRHFVEAFLSGINSLVKHLLQSNLTPERINFIHSRPDDISPHQETFNAPIYFHQPANELIYSNNVLSKTVLMSDKELFSILKKHTRTLINNRNINNAWTVKVLELLEGPIIQEEKSLVKISKILAVSPRKLQGKLRTEGQTFSKLKDKVRKDMAIDYLENTKKDISLIAGILGFSEQSSFSKSFKQWTGLSPNQYRNKSNL